MTQYLNYDGLVKLWEIIQSERDDAIDTAISPIETKATVTGLDSTTQTQATDITTFNSVSRTTAGGIGQVSDYEVNQYLEDNSTPIDAIDGADMNIVNDDGTIAMLTALKNTKTNVDAHAASISTINNTTIPGINDAIAELQTDTSDIAGIPIATIQELTSGGGGSTPSAAPRLATLTGLTLSPAFDPAVTSYTATSNDIYGALSFTTEGATAADVTTVAKANGKTLAATRQAGQTNSATDYIVWTRANERINGSRTIQQIQDGTNMTIPVEISVTDGTSTTTYTITVTAAGNVGNVMTTPVGATVYGPGNYQGTEYTDLSNQRDLTSVATTLSSLTVTELTSITTAALGAQAPTATTTAAELVQAIVKAEWFRRCGHYVQIEYRTWDNYDNPQYYYFDDNNTIDRENGEVKLLVYTPFQQVFTDDTRTQFYLLPNSWKTSNFDISQGPMIPGIDPGTNDVYAWGNAALNRLEFAILNDSTIFSIINPLSDYDRSDLWFYWSLDGLDGSNTEYQAAMNAAYNNCFAPAS